MKRILLLLSPPEPWSRSARAAASAHPHVWVTVKSELVVRAGRRLAEVRHHWTFDEMFSTFATQGLDTNKDGEFSREELQGLAEVNVSSLKEFAYFTIARADGKKFTLADPKDYWLEHKDGALTLNFTLPVQTPLKAKAVEIDVFDGTYFVDFSLAKGGAVSLVSAPGAVQARRQQAGRRYADGITAAQRVLFQQSRSERQFRRALRQQDCGQLPVRRGERDAAGLHRPGQGAAFVVLLLGCLVLIACGRCRARARQPVRRGPAARGVRRPLRQPTASSAGCWRSSRSITCSSAN